jgi:hypothetical protein
MKIKRTEEIGIVIGFALILCFFAIATFVVQRSQYSYAEKRKLAAMPKLRKSNWTQFPSGFETWASDRMALRTQLVSARNVVKYDLLGVAGNPKVLIGKDRWLYALSEGSAPVFRHERLFTQEELDTWKAVLEQRTQWCKEHGINYVFVVAPDKPSIYPEYLPEGYKPVRRESKLEQLAAYLRNDPKLTFVNLSDDLLANKNKARLYLVQDTHWNDRGAWVGYNQLMHTLQRFYPQLKPRSESEIRFETQPRRDGDCLNLAGLHGYKFEYAPKTTYMAPVPKQNINVLMLHDSFGGGLKPLMLDHFAKLDCISQARITCDADVVLEHKPDLLIQEIVERRFAQQIPNFIEDWGPWVAETVHNNAGGHGVWLCLVPNTEEVQVERLSRFLKPQHLIMPISCRVWSPHGDSVTFDPKRAAYPDFYLLKSGNQGFKLLDAESETAYKQLQDFVTTNYKEIGQRKMLDGSLLHLYKKV